MYAFFGLFVCDCRLLSSRVPLMRINAAQTAMLTTTASKSVQLKIVQPTNLDKLSYEEKNTQLKREQSPHLTIYKPQLTSMLSISHRISGTCVCVLYENMSTTIYSIN